MGLTTKNHKISFLPFYFAQLLFRDILKSSLFKYLGGVSGLFAAAELSRSGFCNITILEAADRPGGRVNTYKLEGNNSIGCKKTKVNTCRLEGNIYLGCG